MRKTHRTMNIERSGRTTHKLLSTAMAVFLLFGTTVSVLAETEFDGNLNSVSITDSAGNNNPPTANFTYSQDGDTFTFDASGSSDSDGNITEYKWDFGDGSKGDKATTTHTYGSTGVYSPTLTVLDNNGGITLHKITINTNPFHFAVNFQPANVPLPEGFLMDYGLPFNSGLGYGWTVTPASMGTRDRNASISHDQSYDTLITVAPTAVWEVDVPNGNYAVTICSGDASFPGGFQNMQAEGITVIDNFLLSSTTPWVEKTANIRVSDGKLSITFAQSTNPARLCWLTITSIN